MHRTIVTLAVLIALGVAVAPAVAAGPPAALAEGAVHLVHHPHGYGPIPHWGPPRVYKYGGYYAVPPLPYPYYYRSYPPLPFPGYYCPIYPPYYGGSVGVYGPNFSFRFGF
jgi:hypothetical protein